MKRARRLHLHVTAALLVVLSALFVWHEHRAQAALRPELEHKRALLEWLGTQPALALIDSHGERLARDNSTLLSAVHESLSAQPLAQGIDRIESRGEHSATVLLRGARFDQLVVWLERLGRDFDTDVDALRLSRSDRPGSVDGEAVLVKSGS